MKTYFKRYRSPIENMKDKWADADISPKEFFKKFYKKYSNQSYTEFLEMIHIFEKYSPSLKKAVEDFEKSISA